MFRNGLIFRIIGVVVLICLIAGGIFMAFRAGEAQGISQSPAVATAFVQSAENGQPVPLPPMMYGNPYGYGYGYPMYGPHHGFFPFGAICGSIFFLFLFFGAMKMLFFRRMAWHRSHMHGPWSRHWEGGLPPVFNEWHKRAHGEQPEDEKKEETPEEKM